MSNLGLLGVGGPKAAPPAIDARIVGAHGSHDDGPVTTTAGTSQVSGSTFVAFVSYGSGVASVSSVTDSKGNTYSPAGSRQVNGDVALEAWVCQNGTGGASHTATATMAAGGGYPTIFFVEVTGALAASLDQVAGAADSATPFQVTTPTLAQANELILACAAWTGFETTKDNGTTDMTFLENETNDYWWTACVGKRIVSSTTAQTCSFTTAITDTDCALKAVTFKAA